MGKIRSFIAVQLPPEIKQTLSRIQDRLKYGSRTPVKWVDMNNLHLTLKFLGDIDVDSVDPVLNVLQQAAGETGALHLELAGLGMFPNGRRVRIAWAGLGGDIQQLGALQSSIEKGLVPLGFAQESRSFQAHLTIGRVRDQASSNEREDLGRLIEQYATLDKHSFSVSTVYLMKSTLTFSGPLYAELGSVSLG